MAMEPAAADDEMELASVLAPGENADVHLVLPATWQGVSIRQTVDRFEIFQPARLLFTMLDQAAVYGPLIQEAWRTQKPLSFISSGTVGSTALRAADLGWIVARLFDAARETGGRARLTCIRGRRILCRAAAELSPRSSARI